MYHARYRESHWEKVADNHKRYREENPDKIKMRNENYKKKYPNKKRESQKRWRENNLDIARTGSQRHRNKKRKLPHSFTNADWDLSLKYWNGCCAYCGNQRGLWQ